VDDSTRGSPPTRTVVLAGELDADSTPRVRRRIAAAIRVSRTTGCAVVVDCTEVTFVESRGLGMMASLQRRANDEGCSLTWRGLNAQALTAIHLTGLDGALTIEL
jgi:anti-anti-sigma factor